MLEKTFEGSFHADSVIGTALANGITLTEWLSVEVDYPIVTTFHMSYGKVTIA